MAREVCDDRRARAIDDHVQKRSKGTHIGTNEIILNHLSRSCRWFLLQTLKDLRELMRSAPANAEEPLLILCTCDWGKHRSLGLVWFIDCLLKDLGHQTHVWHMNRDRWSYYNSRGRNSCTGSDENSAQKMQLAAEVFGLWDRMFEPPTVA